MLGSGTHTTKGLLRDWLCWLMLLAAGGVAADEFSISANPTDSSDGTVRLTWSVPGGALAHIQRDTGAGFADPASVYLGADGASVITGLTDGQYFFRGRLQFSDGRVSAWSDAVAVTVQHHSLNRALVFFLLGAVVFLATLLLIVSGARRAGTNE